MLFLRTKFICVLIDLSSVTGLRNIKLFRFHNYRFPSFYFPKAELSLNPFINNQFYYSVLIIDIRFLLDTNVYFIPFQN